MVADPERSIEARLADLADALEPVGSAGLADVIVARLGAPPSAPPDVRRRPALGTLVRWAAAILLAAAILGALPPTRSAVARWFGLDGTSITVVPSLPRDAPTAFDLDPGLGDPTSLATARRRVPIPVLAPPALGPPDAYLDRPPGGATLVWPEDQVVISQHPADLGTLRKQVLPGAAVEAVVVEGHPGYWVTGPEHVIDDDGTGPGRPRRAGNTLAWSVDGVVIRIEIDGTLDRARTIARALRP